MLLENLVLLLVFFFKESEPKGTATMLRNKSHWKWMFFKGGNKYDSFCTLMCKLKRVKLEMDLSK